MALRWVEKKLGSISMPSAPFRLRTPLRGTARASQRPIDRPEPRLGSAHGSLDLLRMGGHGGETLAPRVQRAVPERRVG